MSHCKISGTYQFSRPKQLSMFNFVLSMQFFITRTVMLLIYLKKCIRKELACSSIVRTVTEENLAKCYLSLVSYETDENYRYGGFHLKYHTC